MRKQNTQRIENLRQKKSQIEAELQRLEARSRAQARKNLTRQKILIGAIVMQEMFARPNFDAWVRKLLNARLIRERDRALFGLKPLPKVPEEPSQGETE